MTIKEISEALNVSISTVSKALNDATDIADDTKNMIRKYAAGMGYRLKAHSHQPKRICVLYERVDYDTRNNVLNHVISSFTDIAIANNCEVIIDYVASKPEDFNLNLYLEKNNFCAAFILGMTLKSRIRKQLKFTKVPLVLLDNHIANAPLISSISSENTNAIVSAIKYLNSKGHDRIGFLMGEKESYVCAERLAGYILGLAQAGIDFNNHYIFYGDFTKASGEDAAIYFNETDVTAVICCSDIMAMGLIDGLKSCDKCVPDDVSVIGFDDLTLLKFTQYNLTTLKQDFEMIGQQAYKQIIDMLDGRASQHIMLGCKLIERGSVKNLKDEKSGV